MGSVVIVGGGYAGLHAFGEIRKRLGSKFDTEDASVTLVGRDPYHTYHGWTGEVLAGRLSVGSTLTKLPTLLGGRYVEGDVFHISLSDRVVSVRTPDGLERQLPYNQLLVATGSRDPFGRLPGLAEHGYCLKNTRDMQRFTEQLGRFEGQSIAVVGGGMAGAETASALAERFSRLGRDVTVKLITSGELLFRQLHPRFSALAEAGTAILHRQRIAVRRNANVCAVTARGPILDDGELIPADMTVVAAGIEFAAVPGLEQLSSTAVGRYIADPCLRALGHDDVWLAGDIAEVASPRGGGSCPIDALWAMKQGDLAGANIARALVGKSAERFSFTGLGQAARLGSGSGISELYGITFHGWLAWLVRVVFFAWFMPRRSDGIHVLRRLLAGWLNDRANQVLGGRSRQPEPSLTNAEADAFVSTAITTGKDGNYSRHN